MWEQVPWRCWDVKDIVADFKEFTEALVEKTAPTKKTSWYNALVEMYHGIKEEGLLILSRW